MKSFTDLEQSKVLSEILPLDSADMNWHELPSTGYFVRAFPYKHGNGATEGIFPCWSLSSLLGVLPNYQLQTQDDGIGILCSCNRKFNIVTADNPIDACYELIIELNEQNLL